VLGMRLLGSGPGVDADRQRAAGAASLTIAELDVAQARSFWHDALARATSSPVTLRLGALPATMDAALDMLLHHLDEAWIMAGIGAGGIRWSGNPSAERIRLLRHAAAQHEMPLTLERAPWPLRQQLGHFGAYREGVGQLVGSLRETFDPAGVLLVPLGES
jgi:hypothetical protein